ncbi:MAG: CsbD family protein [Aquabacterium sp.]|nr:CsbD family protein [Aquabacterium sp.]
MNKDQVKGSLKEVAGKVQKTVGEVVGNPTQQAKGAVKEAQGKAQQVLGDAKQLVKDVAGKK